MKPSQILTLVVAVLMVGACLVIPAGNTPALAAIHQSCPDNTDTCAILIAQLKAEGDTEITLKFRDNNIDECSTECGGKRPGHWLKGDQKVCIEEDYTGSDGVKRVITPGSGMSGFCETTTITVGDPCGNN